MKKNFSRGSVNKVFMKILIALAIVISLTVSKESKVFAVDACYSAGSCPIYVDLSTAKTAIGPTDSTDLSFVISGIFQNGGPKVLDIDFLDTGATWTGPFPYYGGTVTGNSGVLGNTKTITVVIENNLGNLAADSVLVKVVVINVNFSSSPFLKGLVATNSLESGHI